MPPVPLVTPRRAEQILLELVPEDQWKVYSYLWTEAEKHGIRIAMGGGLALSAASGYVRNTKDMDLFVVEKDHGKLLAIMKEGGFTEYTEYPYDPTWSYRGFRNGYIVDILWRMLNGRAVVDDRWVTAGWEITVRGTKLRLLPPEELLWSKLYIMRRDRCDWPDLLNLIFTQGPQMEWDHLIERVGSDIPLLTSLLVFFRWMCPGRSKDIPASVWQRLEIPPAGPEQFPFIDRKRTALFEADNWFKVGEG